MLYLYPRRVSEPKMLEGSLRKCEKRYCSEKFDV